VEILHEVRGIGFPNVPSYEGLFAVNLWRAPVEGCVQLHANHIRFPVNVPDVVFQNKNEVLRTVLL